MYNEYPLLAVTSIINLLVISHPVSLEIDKFHDFHIQFLKRNY